MTFPAAAFSAIVESIANPSAPPTCCIVFSTPEAMPESAGETACTTLIVIGMKTSDTPMGISTTNGKMSDQ